MKQIISLSLLIFAVYLFLGTVNIALAQAEGTQTRNGEGSQTPVSGQLDNPLGDITFEQATQNVTNAILGVSGVLALVAFVWGGFYWMTSLGDPAKITKGRTMMIWAVFGIVVIFASYAILKFVFDAIYGAK